ncbi:prepilin-type N-terminal cleavage/methylation domain-containing protein [Desulfotomaculum arcticum]|uniref:Prepilin-type N-terminal cleavage/methylation domain-containing protein n=2 Tax=Desulfotruncus TaxID=2867377 RepID=A0A1I2MT98_9FIRM|nr:prepilin-type N-terminal cleavage/methylation domain-containing protein [Desulfotomaculum arcticum] [Desulfotruncus arcticus DSM 17038]
MIARNMKLRSGYTLVEILVVLVIMSIIMAIAIPDFKDTYFRRILLTAALSLQQEVRTTGQDCLRLEFAKYYILLDTSGERCIIYERTGVISHPIKVIKMPYDVDLVSTNYAAKKIEFSAIGYPTTGGHIALKSKITGDFKYVIITPVTGRSRVSDALAVE